MSGFKLGGKTAEELGIMMRRESQRPILPGTRDNTLTVPGRHGAYDFGAHMEARLFRLDCVFVGTASPTDLQAKARALAKHLIGTNGQPRNLELIFDAEPDRAYTVRYAGSLPVERLARIGTFTLPLIAYDPHAYGVGQEAEQVVETLPGGMVIESGGNVETPPVIVITNEGPNTISGFKLSHLYEIEVMV